MVVAADIVRPRHRQPFGVDLGTAQHGIDAAAGLAVLARELCERARVYTFSNSLVEVPAYRGLALARMISHKTFVSLETMAQRARAEIVQPHEDAQSYRLTHPVESYMLH